MEIISSFSSYQFLLDVFPIPPVSQLLLLSPLLLCPYGLCIDAHVLLVQTPLLLFLLLQGLGKKKTQPSKCAMWWHFPLSMCGTLSECLFVVFCLRFLCMCPTMMSSRFIFSCLSCICCLSCCFISSSMYLPSRHFWIWSQICCFPLEYNKGTTFAKVEALCQFFYHRIIA